MDLRNGGKVVPGYDEGKVQRVSSKPLDQDLESLQKHLNELKKEPHTSQKNGLLAKVKNLSRNKKIILSLSIVLLFSLFTMGALMATGLDKSFLKAGINGYVYNHEGDKVPAVIFINGEQKLETFNGYYEINDLEYGTHKIRIETRNYGNLQEEITLGRLEKRTIDFTLPKVDFAEVRGEIQSEEGQLNREELQVLVNEGPVEVNQNGVFVDEKVRIGTVKIEIRSPNYIDKVFETQIKPGQNELSIPALIPAVDLKITTRDFLRKEPIKTATIKIGDTEYLTDDSGIAKIEDIRVQDKLTLEISKDNYNNQTVEINPRENNKADLELVPGGKIYYTSEREGNNQIYESNYDGSEEKPVYVGVDNASNVYQSGNQLLFYLDGQPGGIRQIYAVNLTDLNINKISNLQGNIEDEEKIVEEYPFIESNTVLYTEISKTKEEDQPAQAVIYRTDLDGNNRREVFKTEVPPQTSFNFNESLKVSQNGEWVVFAYERWKQEPGELLESKIFITKSDGSGLKEIYSQDQTSGSQLLGITNDGRYVLFLLYKNEQSTLQVLNTGTEETQSLGSVNLFHTYVYMDNSSQKAYLNILQDSNNNIFEVDWTLGKLQKITEENRINRFKVKPEENLIFFENEGKLLINATDSDNGSVDSGISTNFEMWPTSNNIQLGV